MSEGSSTGAGRVRGPFAALGRTVVRFRWIVVVLWIVAAAVVPQVLPSLASAVKSQNTAFLPAGTPVVRAQVLAAPFERRNSLATLLLAGSPAHAVSPAGSAAFARMEAAVGRVRGVADVRDRGVSPDGRVRLALVELSGFGARGGDSAVFDRMRTALRVAAAPPGFSAHFAGELAASVDADAAQRHSENLTQQLSILFIVVLLLIVFRAALAPIVTLLPAALSLVVAGPVIAEAAKAGLDVSPLTQLILIVIVLGAGTDYGLFLIFRVREELARGTSPREAVAFAMSRVGETITFSALTVIAALVAVILAQFGLYRGLGPGLAIGIAVTLLGGLTLLPALLAIFGRAVMWPSKPRPGHEYRGAWGGVAARVIARPGRTLALGVAVFGALALAVLWYTPAGFGSQSPPGGSDAARGETLLAHFPSSVRNPTNVVMRLRVPLAQDPAASARAGDVLRVSGLFTSIVGPEDPAGSRAQYVSPDGRTVQFYVALRAGDPSSTAALNAIPAVRAAVARAARAAGAAAWGVAGEAAAAYDVSHVSSRDLLRIVPLVLVVIAILLAVLLRSLVAPVYLIVSVGISYLAALGLAILVFVKIGGDGGLNFVLPFFMFVFLMALGEDYNILVMTRIREEAHRHELPEAVRRAIAATGGTVTSAGLVLAGTFAVLTVAGNRQAREIGLGLAAGVLLDTFLVRTLLIPSLVVLLGERNWWPFGLPEEGGPAAARP